MKILLAVDGSECSERAAAFLTRFDFTPEDEIVIFHVISEIPYDDDSYANIRRFMKRVAPKVLNSAAKIIEPVRAKITKQEIEGYPDSTIKETAENENFDLIVMGTRGLRGIKSLFEGSVTRSVVINSTRPVLVTRSPHWQPGKQMKVLFATDGFGSADTAAGCLASIPFPSGTECVVINVMHTAYSDVFDRFATEEDRIFEEDTARIRELEQSQAERIVEKAKERLSERFVNVSSLVRSGYPSEEILGEAEKFQPDIIAVGSRGLKGVKGMMGSVSRRILTHSPCPVLVGKVRP